MNTVLTPALDGARILWRDWRSEKAQEGFVREFAMGFERVRISRTQAPVDCGVWIRTADVRVDAILDPQKAPKARSKGDENASEPSGET